MLMIGVLIVALLPIYFSVAQNYGPTEIGLLNKLFSFIMPNKPVYLYAIVEPNKYTISFNGNWSTAWSMESMNMIYDQQANLLENGFTRDWYIFKWWSTSEAWTAVEFLDQATVENLATEDGDEVILYAKRTVEIPYKINYYQENLAWDDYELIETSDELATNVSRVVLTWRTYTWFTLQTWDEISINTDWSSVVSYYYKRNTYNLTVVDKERSQIYIDTWIKYGADITSILPESPTWWTWNIFLWWLWIPENGLMPDYDIEITSEWIFGEHSIMFDTDWWTEIPIITGNYGDPIIAPKDPTKDWYEFDWWESELPTTIPYDDITLTAKWKEKWEQKWSWRSGWWGRRTSSWENQHGAAIDQTAEWINKNRSSMEVLIAYMWARRNWIINKSRKNSDPDWYVTRWDMAEMVVKFTENVIGKKAPSKIPEYCKRSDIEIEWSSPERKMYAEKSCALWVMWIRTQDFMPNKILDRAEFGTILSRLLRWSKYDIVDATNTKPFYTRHLEALKQEWIMTQIDNPVSRKEIRKWAWLMLMRVKLE